MRILSIVLYSSLTCSFAYEFQTELKSVSYQDHLEENSKSSAGIPFETKLGLAESRGLPSDNGGNYGDLIYRFRENRDTLLLREVVINEVLTSDEQDIRWHHPVPFSYEGIPNLQVDDLYVVWGNISIDRTYQISFKLGNNSFSCSRGTSSSVTRTVSFSGPRVTSVRVLNFGRSRAYCLRIDVAGGDVQIFLRVPPLGDPRVMIEVYGI